MDRRSWNPLFTVRWTVESGDRAVTGTSRDIHAVAPRLHQRGGEVWDIAVYDEHGHDVTARFFDRLDNAA